MSLTARSVPTQARISGRIGGRQVSVRYGGDARDNPDAAVPGLLLSAMLAGRSLEVPGPVSPRLLEGAETVQDVIRLWDRRHVRVPLVAEPATGRAAPRSKGVGACFSGGVDSFYTALRHRERLTHLVFVHGFDIALEEHELRDQTSRALRAAASAMGLELIELDTDVRVALDPPWELHHGAALASVGHLLAHRVGTMLIPSSHSYRDLFPWGSHVVLDHLWSSDRVDFVHDGAGTTRVEKVRAIARDDVALRHLRVCWRGAAYNCGVCEKCTRTMVALRLAGALDRASTFPDELDLARVKRLRLASENDVSFALENLDAAAGHDPPLHDALRSALRASRVHRQVAHIRDRAAIRTRLGTISRRLRETLA